MRLSLAQAILRHRRIARLHGFRFAVALKSQPLARQLACSQQAVAQHLRLELRATSVSVTGFGLFVRQRIEEFAYQFGAHPSGEQLVRSRPGAGKQLDCQRFIANRITLLRRVAASHFHGAERRHAAGEMKHGRFTAPFRQRVEHAKRAVLHHVINVRVLRTEHLSDDSQQVRSYRQHKCSNGP